MENEKYYTPEIEDFYIGYEFEMEAGTGWSKQIFPDPWWNHGGMGGIDTLIRCLESGNIRVPFLTREQIEKEGWKADEKAEFTDFSEDYFKHVSVFNHHFIYQLHVMTTYIEKVGSRRIAGKHVSITSAFIRYDQEESMKKIDQPIFKGKCPSINEFRKMIKLLGIDGK